MHRFASRLALRRACGLALLAWAGCAAAVPTGSGHPLLRGCEPLLAEQCIDVLEQQALRPPRVAAQREGPLLRFASGTPQQFEDTAAGTHRLLGPLGETSLLLVLWQRPGQAPQFLLQGEGALTLPLPAAPWAAPGGRLMALATPARGGQASALWLLGRVGPQWRVLERLEGRPGLGFTVQGWRTDAAALRLHWQCADGSAGGPLQWRDGPYGWDLVPAWPADACR